MLSWAALVVTLVVDLVAIEIEDGTLTTPIAIGSPTPMIVTTSYMPLLPHNHPPSSHGPLIISSSSRGLGFELHLIERISTPVSGYHSHA